MSNDDAKGSDGRNDGGKAGRIRDKINASQARSRGAGEPRKASGGKADAADSTSRRESQREGLSKVFDDHPLALLAGSMVLGAVAASLVPASLGRKFGSRMLGFAAVAGDLGATYGSKAWGLAAKGARAGQERLDEVGGTIAEKGDDARRRASEMRALAGRRAIEIAEAAAANAREARSNALKRLGDLSAKVRD